VDTHFLEFWGNFLLSAARGQRQVEEFTRWMSQGMSGLGDLNRMFRQFYGLESGKAADEKSWNAARASFEKAYRDYLDVLGVVPQAEYRALLKRFEALQQKTEEQEAAIRRLRLELGESRMAQGDAVRGFQELIQVQSEQFREVADSFSRFFAGRREEKKDPSKP
jgi:hypothetical protein